METRNPPPLKRERQQTDKSLHIERGKSDESFEEYKEKAESETDKAVSANRLEADQARLQRRSDADVAREATSEDISERKSEDNAIERERKKNDLAIELERGEKERLLQEIVQNERQTTDKNLSGERAKTDQEVAVTAKQLVIEQAEHLQTKSALTTREEFVAIVSHDLRNPIGAILSSTEILLRGRGPNEITDKVKKFVEIIQRSAQTSLRLITDILDTERITDGRIQLSPSRHSVRELVRECVDSHAHFAASKNISLTAPNTDISDSANFDRDRVAQILSNLVGNALKFTPDGGTVTLALTETDDEIMLSVRDNGPGIPADQQERIFERFAQIQNKDRRGLGLGLYISKTLVESHGGKLWVTSTPGNGSTFCFTLPKSGQVT